MDRKQSAAAASKSSGGAASKSGGAAKAEQASAHSKGAADRGRINIKMVQNVLLIWLDNNIDDSSVKCRNTITQLRRAVNTISTFTDSDRCVQFLEDMQNDKTCMIISGSLGQHVVPCVHNMSQVDSIFIFCGNKKYHEQWAREWPKIKGVFTEIGPICAALKTAAQQCEQDVIPMSFMATGGNVSNKNLDQLDPSFMYTTIMKEILLTIKFEPKHFMEFIQYCRDVLADNEAELKNVKQFERKYRDETPIWWYTFECFLYPMLNRALRMMDADIIIKMGFFIGDLHRHIDQLHKKQFGGHKSNKSFTVYRGQGMSKTGFEKLTKTKGGLIAFNNFLSTSKDREVSLDFARRALPNPDLVGILFVMAIDPFRSTTPFASIIDVSYFKEKEEEVLFAMHSVFRIGDITSMGEHHRLFRVELTLTSDNDQDLRRLTDRIREETRPDVEGWYRLGVVLWKMGQSEKAQQVYEILLEQATEESTKAPIYQNLGVMKYNQGEYQEAIMFYEKALKIHRKTLPPNDPELAKHYNNIGAAYDSMGDCPKALSSHKKALAIRQQSLPPNHPNLASSYYNIGAVYVNTGDYPKALSFYEKALAIQQQSLPPNHPDLAKSYTAYGIVYNNMKEHSKATVFYEKALKIQQQSLPSNHPDLAGSYYNIGSVYFNMGDYPKALSSYEKVLAIQQQSLPPNHPDLAKSYIAHGTVYNNMKEHSKAIVFYEKALKIQQQSLPSNHPDLGMSFNNIGSVYFNMGEYSKALPYFKKSLEIQQQSLPPNHPDLAASYNNIGRLYGQTGEYAKALPYFKKSLEIQQQSLPPNHPDLAESYIAHGIVYNNMKEHSKAIVFYEKALKIQQQSLPSNHPDLGMSFNNIGSVYFNMREYSKARSFYERAVENGQHSLPSTHPNLQLYRENLDRVKKIL